MQRYDHGIGVIKANASAGQQSAYGFRVTTSETEKNNEYKTDKLKNKKKYSDRKRKSLKNRGTKKNI